MERTVEDFLAELDQLGEAQVRRRLIFAEYGGERRAAAEEWLRQQDQRRIEASISAQTRIALSAKNIAIASMIITTTLSVIAITISIAALFR